MSGKGAAKLKALQDAAANGPPVDPNGPVNDIALRDYGDNDHVTDARGNELMKEAARKMGKFSLFADKNRNEKCMAMYEEAGKCYRMNENWLEAAEAFEKAAEIAEMKMNQPVEAASYYVRAAGCYRQVDLFDALKAYQLAVALHMNGGRLGSAAKLWRDIAELLMEESKVADALEAYQKSAACHEAEETLASAVQCYLAMADIYLKNEDFEEAAVLFKKAHDISVEKKINVGSHVEFAFKSLLCEFVPAARAWEISSVQSHVQAFLKTNRRYEGTKEWTLLQKCLKAFDDEDVKTFKQAVHSANKIRELDEQTTFCLVLIQRAMLDGPREEFQDEDDLDIQ